MFGLVVLLNCCYVTGGVSRCLRLAVLYHDKFVPNRNLQRRRIGEIPGIWTKDLGCLGIVKEAHSVVQICKSERGAAVVGDELKWVLRTQCIGSKEGFDGLRCLSRLAMELEGRAD